MTKGIFRRSGVAALFWFGIVGAGHASTWSGIATADSFVAAGSPTNPAGTDLTANNYGGAGTLAISSSSSADGDFQSLLKFNLAAAKAQFDVAYGIGDWQITNITLTLGSNLGTAGAQMNTIFNPVSAGGFGISWLADDSWVEGSGNPMGPSNTGVNYNSLSGLLTGSNEQVGTYNYTPPGTNVAVTWNLGLTGGFTSDATAGGDVSFLFYATPGSNVSYLFNAHTFATNKPTITITAVPEPATLPLLMGGLAVASLTLRRLRRA